MNISYNWLKQYIDVDLDPHDLAAVLTGIGLEVESVETVEKVKGGLKGFVIGEVVSCNRHPGADHLYVTKVDIGAGQLLDVVCGAPNVATGQRVIVATEGSTVYKGSESLRIKKTRIRGIVSEAMICAEDEVGLGDRHEGVMVLPSDAVVGTPAAEYLNLQPDIRFGIGLTPNRIDAASHYGVARDLAAYLGKEKKIRLVRPDVTAFHEGDDEYRIEVVIENTQACRRYAGVCMTGVHVAPSPLWLQERLLSVGLNPVNNVVDISNFVLYELGQPLHTFDADELAGRQIIVKNLPEGSRFVTLDGTERILSPEDLMICDAEKPVAIGGVFGGLQSGITDTTRNIFIESAYFNPITIRRTSKRHQLYTDASFRFERGVDPEMTLTALKRCALLISEIAGGTVASSIVDVYPEPVVPAVVNIRYNNISALIGTKLEDAAVRSILESLDFTVLKEDRDGMQVRVPPCRVDVTREADVIEEILRIYGYNAVGLPQKLSASLSFSRKPDPESMAEKVSNHLCSHGFYEIMCNSLTKSAYYDSLTSWKSENLVRILNPISSDLNVLRQTLIFGGLETIIHNMNRQRPDLKLFEFGNCYHYDADKSCATDPLRPYREERLLSLFMTGKAATPGWNAGKEIPLYFQLKGHLETVLALMGCEAAILKTEIFSGKGDLYSSAIRYSLDGNVLAELALLNNEIVRNFGMDGEVVYAELPWATLVTMAGRQQIRHNELPRYPEVRRDLSLLLDQSVSYEQVKEIALTEGGRLLKRINLFDVYEGDKVEKGKKSYAISFILQDSESTLTDAAIDRFMLHLMDAYRSRLGAVIR